VSRGNLFIVSAPSGAGKTTLCRRLGEVLPDIRHSVSYTTRKPRQGEVNDRDYTFISEEKFLGMAEAGEFLEWAKVHGNLYGTSEKRLEEMLRGGIDVILDIDTQGARQIRERCGEGLYIFILPPSMDALGERLLDRMSNPEDEIRQRMLRAVEEIRDYKMYNYVIVNDVFEDALERLKAIVLSRRLLTEKIDPLWIEENFLSKEER
jgi:guanylate kinase